MRVMQITMLVEKGKDEMEPIMKELVEKYKPKQLHFHECEWFER